MNNIKSRNENNQPTQNNNSNINTANKTAINSEFNFMKQDLLFFKNDILKDFRKIEEKLNLKITEQNMIISQHYELYEKKLDSLSAQISLTNSLFSDNSDMMEKINAFQSFKSKTEDKLININVKMNNIQKEYKEYFENMERLINDNLKYPGIIGKNSRFQNFRYFIDYVLKYFKEFNQFRDEVKNFDLYSLKRKINTNLVDFRYAISDGYRNTLCLFESNVKKTDQKFADMVKNNKTIMDEYEEKLKELKNQTAENLEEYKNKFADLEKNMNDKYQDQLNEIENLKKLKDQVKNDLDNIKVNFKSNKLNEEEKNETNENKYVIELINKNYMSDGQQILNENNNDNISEKEINKGINNEIKKEINLPLSLSTINDNNLNSNQIFTYSKGKRNFIFKKIMLNNNNIDKNDSSIEKNSNNIFDIIPDSEERFKRNDSNIEYLSRKIKNNTHTVSQSKSFEKLYDNLDIKNDDYNINDINVDNNGHNQLISSKKRFSLTQDQSMNIKERSIILNSKSLKEDEKNSFNKYNNSPKRDTRRNNYSITNIADIKIKKVVLPTFLVNRNIKRVMSNSSLSENKRFKNVSNIHLSSSNAGITKEEINKNKIKLDISKINKRKFEKIKISKLSESSKMINKLSVPKISENVKSLVITNIKQKTNTSNNKDIIRKGKTRNISMERKKNEMSQTIPTLIKKNDYEKSNSNGLILINPKHYTYNSDIKF